MVIACSAKFRLPPVVSDMTCLRGTGEHVGVPGSHKMICSQRQLAQGRTGASLQLPSALPLQLSLELVCSKLIKYISNTQWDTAL
ncbi:hypothetical protein AOLI_G00167180 [Acnodon oligacanthus]